MSDSSSNGKGLDFVGALQLSFIVLKLTGFINWAWWQVLIPLWLYLAVFVIALIALVVKDIMEGDKWKY